MTNTQTHEDEDVLFSLTFTKEDIVDMVAEMGLDLSDDEAMRRVSKFVDDIADNAVEKCSEKLYNVLLHGMP